MLPTQHGERNTGATPCGSLSAAGCGGLRDPQSLRLADSLAAVAGPSGLATPVVNQGSPGHVKPIHTQCLLPVGPTYRRLASIVLRSCVRPFPSQVGWPPNFVHVSEAKGREVADMRESKGGPDGDPNRQRFSQYTRSVTRALRLAAMFVLQVVVVAGVRKVVDWLIS